MAASRSTTSTGIAAAFVPTSSFGRKSLLTAAVVTSSIPLSQFLTRRNMSSGSDEVAKAQTAKDDGEPTVFDKILSKEWDSTKVYEDDLCYAFKDISPQAPTHVVLIPKKRDGLTQLSNAREDQKDILGHLMFVASQVGKQECPNGFRIVINDGKDGAQSVYHLHLHILGGRQMSWPPG